MIERLLEIAEKFGSVAKIPKKEIFASSADGATVVLNDGTKVSEERIAEAKKAAAEAAKKGKKASEE